MSATGMFKIAYPWASHAEEREEREYLKSKEETSQDEVAGNVWIAPELGISNPNHGDHAHTDPHS